MDRTGIIVVSLCVVLLGFWFVQQQKQAVRAQQEEQQRRREFAATNTAAATQTAPGPAAVSTTTSAVLVQPFDTNAPEQMIVLTNANARYTFTSRGGGLKQVELLHYPETISPQSKIKSHPGGVATLNTHAPVPVLAVLGNSNLVGDGVFALAKISNGVVAEKSLPGGLRLVKKFRIGTNYLVDMDVRLENTLDEPLALPAQEWIVGTATPMGPDDDGMNVGTMWCDGTNAVGQAVSYFSTNTTTLVFFPRTPKTEYIAGSGNVVWAAAHNQFFALVAMPREPAAQIIARSVILPLFQNVEQATNGPPPHGVQTAFVYPAATLAAHQAVERQIVFFAGPKEYRTLARIGEDFKNRADLVMGFGGFWGFFAKALLLTMNWLHDVTRWGYGSVIVLITVILKVVFWPFTAAGIRSSRKMQELAPELKVIQDKYKDDLQKMMQKRSELLKKHKVSMMSGCWPMAIQMPVFIGFFTMLRSAIELRGARFLWAADLSKPDTLFMIPGLTFIPFISTPSGLPFNLLPLLMGGSMLWQSHLQPPSPGMDPTQAKMMRYMPLMFLLFLYNYSSGLALYWTVNNVLSIVQTKLTQMRQTPAAAGSIPVLTPPQKRKK